MSLTASIKPVYVCGGLGVAATPAVGYGGWALYSDVINPTADRSLSRKGFRRREASSDLEVVNSNHLHRKYDCFRTFFPINEEVNTTSTTGNGEKDRLFDERITSASAPDPNPMGCALMHMHYESREKFLFKSEVTVQGDQYGLVIGNRFQGKKDSSSNQVQVDGFNTVFFLKHDDSDKRWSIMGGFYQSDYVVDYELSKVHVQSPDSKNTVGGVPTSDAAASTPIQKQYSGIWEATDGSGGRNVLQDLKVKYDNDKVYVLGKDNYSGTDPFKDYDINGAKGLYAYDVQQQKGIMILTSEDKYSKVRASIKEDLKNIYSRFENKQGKWSDFGSFCGELGGARSFDAEWLERVQGFCYTK